MTLFKRMIEKTEMVRHMCRTRFLVVFRRNRQTLWGGCTDANPKLLLNDT